MPIYSIVGSNFYPPAAAILNNLPIGILLELIPEPENQYDENAIAVWINGELIPENNLLALNIEALKSGCTSDDIKAQFWHLGYLPRQTAAFLAPFSQSTGRFLIGSDGKPKVEPFDRSLKTQR